MSRPSSENRLSHMASHYLRIRPDAVAEDRRSLPWGWNHHQTTLLIEHLIRVECVAGISRQLRVVAGCHKVSRKRPQRGCCARFGPSRSPSPAPAGGRIEASLDPRPENLVEGPENHEAAPPVSWEMAQP